MKFDPVPVMRHPIHTAQFFGCIGDHIEWVLLFIELRWSDTCPGNKWRLSPHPTPPWGTQI